MKKSILLFVLLWAGRLAAEELTLERAVQLAMESNASVANALLDVEKVSDRYAATRTRRLPNASFYALGAQQLRPMNYTIERGQLGTFESTGPIPSNDVEFTTPMRPTGTLIATLTQPLVGIYKVRQNLRLLDISREIAKEQARARCVCASM